jgi:hypothetical protein
MSWRKILIAAAGGVFLFAGNASAQNNNNQNIHFPEFAREQAMQMIRNLRGSIRLGPFKVLNPVNITNLTNVGGNNGQKPPNIKQLGLNPGRIPLDPTGGGTGGGGNNNNNNQTADSIEIYPIYEVNLDNSGLTDTGIINLIGLSYLQGIYVNGTRITETGLTTTIFFMFDLRRIYMSRTKLTGVKLTGTTILWPELQELDMSFTAANDIDVLFLAGAPELRKLVLTGTNVTDASIVTLAAMPKLDVVYLGQSRVTSAGIQRLKTLAPQVTVIRGFMPPRSQSNQRL